jgi:membrane-anchored glycerophosphoryl diester phosphodiesterase (GDPDase)
MIFGLNKSKSLVFLKTENVVMKKFTILLMALAIGVALYEQTSADKNVYVMVVAIVIFMMGMMKLSSKTPSKNQDKEDDNV